MEIELFVGLYVALIIGMIVWVHIMTKTENEKGLFIVLVTVAGLAIALFVVAAYMAPLWVAEPLSGALKPL